MTFPRDDDPHASTPPSPPYAPYPPYPPYPPFPPFPPYPAMPCCAPCPGAGGPGDIGPDGQRDDDRDDGLGGGPYGGGTPSPGEPTPPPGEPTPPPPNEPPPPGEPPPPSGGPVLPPRIAVRRPDDLLVFDLIFSGFELRTDPPRIERLAGAAYITIELPPQCFGEEAYLEAASQKFKSDDDDVVEVSSHPDYPAKNVEPPAGTGTESLPAELPAVRVRMAGPSRVVVAMPAEQNSLGFDLVSVLTALRDWPMQLDGAARPDPVVRLPGLLEAATDAGLADLLRPAGGITLSTGGQALVPATAAIAEPALGFASGLDLKDLTPLPILLGPHEPPPTVTALKLPYRLITSPIESAHWIHAPHPVERHGRTELWHTRLTTSESAAGADAPSRIRALWSPDYRPGDRLDEVIALLEGSRSDSHEPRPRRPVNARDADGRVRHLQ